MPANYSVKLKSKGVIKTINITASSVEEAKKMGRRYGIVTSITRKTKNSMWERGMSPSERYIFMIRLSTMLQAKVGTTEALRLIRDSFTGRISQAAGNLLEKSEMGVNINIDNLGILEQFGGLNPEIPICIRINPHVIAGGNNKISVGHIDSKFGISIHQIPLLLRIIKNTNIKVNGIHMHTGSDILDIEVFIHAAEILFDTASKFRDLEFIDFGSGFKVPYSAGDNETNIRPSV